MRDIAEIFFPCISLVLLFFMLFGFIIMMRYISYRETMTLAEKGLVRPVKRNGNSALVWGITLTAIGLALCIGLYPIGFLVNWTSNFPIALGPWLLPGLLPMFFGLGLVLIHVLTRPPKQPADTGSGETRPPMPPDSQAPAG